MAEGESIPINMAKDTEVLDALRDHVVAPLAEAWARALAASAPVAAAAGDKPADQVEASLAPVWKEVWDKLESAEYVVSHLRFRVSHLRAKGVLPGDLREAAVLKVQGP